jgi:cobalt-zinc-cadmium efflux system membrane fusion protein
VIEIGMKVSGDGKLELRPGDPVVKGQPLAVLESATVGLKKTELHDALVKLKLDEQILERAEKAIGAVPEVFILNAKKSVLADLNAVTRVRMGLTALGVDETDLEQVDKEASRTAEKEKADTKEERETRLKEWSRLTLKAPVDGVLIERNIIAGEVLIDGTIKLFRLAKPERLLVLANCPEAELPGLRALKPEDRWWSIKVGDQKPVEGAFDQVGAVVDPDTHTGVVKGGIENKAGLLRAGQYVTARISLPMANEWSLQAAAVVEENGQYFVFVQPDAKRPVYEQRRVLVLRRGQDVVHIRAEPTAEEVKQGVRTVRAGERVVISGAVELKALMDDLKRP